MTILRNFDRRLEPRWFRRRFSAISIGGLDNRGFEDDSGQFWSVARTTVVLTMIWRNFDQRQRPLTSRGKIVVFMYSIHSINLSPYLLNCTFISLDQWWGEWLSNWGFDNDSAQYLSATRTIGVLMTIWRNFHWWHVPPISRGKIFIFMYSRQLWCCRWLGDISIGGNAHLFHVVRLSFLCIQFIQLILYLIRH